MQLLYSVKINRTMQGSSAPKSILTNIQPRSGLQNRVQRMQNNLMDSVSVFTGDNRLEKHLHDQAHRHFRVRSISRRNTGLSFASKVRARCINFFLSLFSQLLFR